MDPSESGTNSTHIIDRYSSLLGDAGLVEFRDNIIPMAEKVLGSDPTLMQKTLFALIRLAMGFDPHELELQEFWREEITEDTFEFQRLFTMLITPCSDNAGNLAFNINRKELLESLNGGAMIPRYILDGFAFDEQNDKLTDDYSVYLATGNIDDLSRFLAGFALINLGGKFEPAIQEPNHPLLSMEYSIAIADTSALSTIQSDHDIITTYTDDRFYKPIPIHISKASVPVKVMRIPVIVLLPDQIHMLMEEGKRWYRSGNFSSENLTFNKIDEEQAAKIYTVARQYELAIKYILLRLLRKRRT